MSHLVRLTDYSITDFFIQQAENSCYCRNQFLKHILLFSSSPTRIAFTPLVSTRFTIPSICLKIGQHDVIFPGNQKVLTLPLSIAAHLLCVGRIFRDTHITNTFHNQCSIHSRNTSVRNSLGLTYRQSLFRNIHSERVIFVLLFSHTEPIFIAILPKAKRC